MYQKLLLVCGYPFVSSVLSPYNTMNAVF